MGLVESTLKVQSTRSLVRAEMVLPSLAVDSCKFTDGSVGFLVTSVDLAKNTTLHLIPLKDMYSSDERTLVYIGKDETTLTFMADRFTGRIFCRVGMSLRQCVTTYDPLGDEQIDMIGLLYSSKSKAGNDLATSA